MSLTLKGKMRKSLPGLKPGRPGEEMDGIGVPQAEAAAGTGLNAGKYEHMQGAA